MIRPSYNLQRGCDLDAAVRELRGFWKLWSACLLQAASLPALRSIIVTEPFPMLESKLQQFLQHVHANEALLRHDIVGETPNCPRGGFLIERERLVTALNFFFTQKRIVAVYEPADPLRNGYNLSILFQNRHDVIVEIVGPGFDASDLQRGDLSPHEAFSLSIATDGQIDDMQRTHSVSPMEYNNSVRLRRAKIQRKFEASPADLSSRADRIKVDPSASIPTIPTYKLIPPPLVIDTILAILSSGVIGRFLSATGVGYPLNFSTSFINRGDRQVYWDIVSPFLKYPKLSNRFFSRSAAGAPA